MTPCEIHTTECETVDNWMSLFGEVSVDNIPIDSPPKTFVELVPLDMNNTHPRIFSIPSLLNNMEQMQFLEPNTGSMQGLGGYNRVFESPKAAVTTSVRGGTATPYPATQGSVKRKPRKVPLSEEKVFENMMKNRQNAAKFLATAAILSKDLKNTVANLEKELKQKTTILNQVLRSLHDEQITTTRLKAIVRSLTAP